MLKLFEIFQEVSNVSSIVFGLFYTVDVVCVVQVDVGCLECLKLCHC